MVSIRNPQTPGLAGRAYDSSLGANGQYRFSFHVVQTFVITGEDPRSKECAPKPFGYTPISCKTEHGGRDDKNPVGMTNESAHKLANITGPFQ